MNGVILLLALLLAACATTTSDHVVAKDADTCRKEGLAQYVGLPATQALGARMLRETGARRLRWVTNNMIVTTDYHYGRLTVQLDAANRVERADCG